MKGSLLNLIFVCSTFLKIFCRTHHRKGVKFNYDLPSDLPMDAKQHAWTTVKGVGYLVIVSSCSLKTREKYTNCIFFEESVFTFQFFEG